ncbi:MAG: hypothetical protein JW973_18150, partial [Bacteroidales bacterium]|nr:hypothetical protein [Bacteroidales bacterium]
MKRFSLLLVFMLFSILVINTVSSQSLFVKKAALVASNAELTVGFDEAIFDRLLSLGYDVQVVTGADVKAGAFTLDDA